MKHRLSLSFGILMVVMLAIGGVAGWAWHKANSVPLHLRAQLGFFAALRHALKKTYPPPTPEQIAAWHQRAVAMKDELTRRFPALKVTPRPVPPEQNGFLLLYQLAGPDAPTDFHLTKDLEQLLDRATEWDPVRVRLCLDENANVVARFEHIASLTTRSSSDMPATYNGFVPVLHGKRGIDILLLKARLAAEAHDEEETLRLLAAAGALSDHYHLIESPTLLTETAAILIEQTIFSQSFEVLLPALGPQADLKRWQPIFKRRRYDMAELSVVMRGEWNNAVEFMYLPVLFAAADQHELTDPEAVAEAYSAWFNANVTAMLSCSPADARHAFKRPGPFPHLSKYGQDAISSTAEGIKDWIGGYTLTASRQAHYQAALDLLILERGGITLTADHATQVTRDPLSGKPFTFDPRKRELGAPAATADSGIRPLALPWPGRSGMSE